MLRSDCVVVDGQAVRLQLRQPRRSACSQARIVFLSLAQAPGVARLISLQRVCCLLDRPGGPAGALAGHRENAHFVGECPKNKRQRADSTTYANMWASRTGVDFDYTMLDEVEGATLGLHAQVGFLPPNANNNVRILSPAVVDGLTLLRGVPLYFEESTHFWNQQYRDGMFGNEDQVTTRHFGGGNVAYIDGSAELFKPPHDGRENIQDRTRDFECNDLYVNVKGQRNTWYSISDSDWRFNTVQPYGWINNPR